MTEMMHSDEKKSEESKSSCDQSHYCCNICKKRITEDVYRYSVDNFGKALCRKHQGTRQAKKLYYALKKRWVKCELEADDGYKHVDISIPQAKLNIEIDGKRHFTDPERLYSDLKRDYWSSKNGFDTIHIPNAMIDEEIEKIADSIAEVTRRRCFEGDM